MGLFGITQVGPKSKNNCPYKKQKRRYTHRGEDHVKTKAEVTVMRPQAQEQLEPPEAGREKEGSFA